MRYWVENRNIQHLNLDYCFLGPFNVTKTVKML
jgi:hypothetical protein